MPRPDHRRTRPTHASRGRVEALRRELSPPEQLLWKRLRGGRLDGWKFRRHHPLGPYAADFYCHEGALVVEVDGLNHLFTMEEDQRRDEWMRSRGLRVLRLSAKRVLA